MIDVNLWNKTRKEQKITLDILSAKSGIPLNTLKNIFSGRTPTPRIDTVQAIERALGLSEHTNAAAPAQSTRLSEKQERLLAAFDALIPALQDYIIETTENLVAQTSKSVATNKRA